MTQQQVPRAELDLAAAQHANEANKDIWWRQQANQPRHCIHCRAEAPSHLKEGESPPCGCP